MKLLFYNKGMDFLEKLAIMANYMHFEPAEELRARPAEQVPQAAQVAQAGCAAFTPVAEENTPPVGAALRENRPAYTSAIDQLPIHQAVMSGGKRIGLLKTLLTSACERDCYYCAFRAGRDFRRATFKPDEMAQAFMRLYQGRAVQGLFLSSGIAAGGLRTQDRLLATAEILRMKMGFKGYLHLKLMPGAEMAQVERAMQLADRVSINLEAPNTRRLSELAPHKTFLEELLRPLQWVEQIRRTQPARDGWKGRWPSTTTQFVVGGAGETDLELLDTTARLYSQLHLARAYYSGFAPVEGTPLENVPAVSPWREHRLYQASFLLHDYGFDLEELPFSAEGNLPLGRDPKLAWAEANLSQRPVEINRADLHELLRIPGVGPKGARAILAARRQGPLHDLAQLRAYGVQLGRAVPYVLVDGRRPAQQLALF
jgi:predicted DNA-binding helix-hairpin-helix protein